MTRILLIAEHDNKELKQTTHHAVTAAQQLNGDIDLLVIGHGCDSVAAQATSLPGLAGVLLAQNEVYEHQLAENCGKLIAEVGKDYNYILAGSSTFSKNLLPYAAALLDVSMLSDVSKVVSEDTFIRPIYAGNIAATIKINEEIKIMTVRTTTFAAVKEDPSLQCEIKKLDNTIANEKTKFVKQELTKSSRPELTNARVVISGGRGLKSSDNFKLIESIADKLGAAIGASRAAVDAGYVPNDYQVGQTGKVVAPDLYIAIGISGAIQHLAGMKDSKVVVAINNDPDAPIFQVSDYGIVGDLFKVLPELESAL